MHGGLLVANQHVADALLAMQRVVNWQDGAAGIAEDRIHAERHQRIEQRLRSADGDAIPFGLPGAGQDGWVGEVAHGHIVRGRCQKRHLIF